MNVRLKVLHTDVNTSPLTQEEYYLSVSFLPLLPTPRQHDTVHKTLLSVGQGLDWEGTEVT